MKAYYARVRAATEGGYVVDFPGVPGAVTQAETEGEITEMATDCIRTHLLGLIAIGRELPESAAGRGRNHRTIVLPALDSAKIQLYEIFRTSGLRKAQLAARMGISRSHVDRLFDLNHGSRLSQIEAALRVLGKTLVVEAMDAA